MIYEELLAQYECVKIKEFNFNEIDPEGDIKGLCVKNRIYIGKCISTNTEKTCILAEELGHYHTTAGNILDQSKVENCKQERRARAWAYNLLAPLTSFIKAHRAGISGRHELAEFLDVTEEFLQEAVDYYACKFGTCVKVDKHIIYFDPLGVMKSI
jgi:Zn-dependent peptidase ImmA (M78 family)